MKASPAYPLLVPAIAASAATTPTLCFTPIPAYAVSGAIVSVTAA
jgi:hypothetical protein